MSLLILDMKLLGEGDEVKDWGFSMICVPFFKNHYLAADYS